MNARKFSIHFPFSFEDKGEFFPIGALEKCVFVWTPQLKTQVQKFICDEMSEDDLGACFITSVRACMREQTTGAHMPLTMFGADFGFASLDINLDIGQNLQIEVINKSNRAVQFRMRVEGVEGAL